MHMIQTERINKKSKNVFQKFNEINNNLNMNYNINNQGMNFQSAQNNKNMMNMNNNNFNQISNLNPNNQFNNNNNNNNNQINIQQNMPLPNVNMNFNREHYKIKEHDSIKPEVKQSSNLIDKNEANEINNIVQQVYSKKINNKNNKNSDGSDESDGYMSDMICDKIKHKINGEWFVLISDNDKDIPLSFSTISESDFLIIILGNTKFQIVKIK